jgi:hypothetical protein
MTVPVITQAESPDKSTSQNRLQTELLKLILLTLTNCFYLKN